MHPKDIKFGTQFFSSPHYSPGASTKLLHVAESLTRGFIVCSMDVLKIKKPYEEDKPKVSLNSSVPVGILKF